MLDSRDGALFEMYSVSNLFLKDFQNRAVMRQLLTFKLSDQHRVERDSQLIFSCPGTAIGTGHIDQALENSSAFARARAHFANSNNVYL